MMGTGEAEGEDRAIKAAELAISNPLLDDTSIANAKGVIINISGGEDVKLYEIDEIAAHIKKQCKEDVNLIVGNTIENIEDGKIRVSLLASGISSHEEEEIMNTENKFVKPRLVSNSENKNIKINSSIKTNTKQADLEDFLSKEINDLQENINKTSSGKKINDNDFFIPKEEVMPNKEKILTTNPFKEADLLNANGNNTNSNDESVSLISRLSSNVKEKAINVGSKAMSMVSEVANKSLENKFMKKDEMEDIKTNDFNSKERVEPSFTSLDKNEENALNTIDNKTTMQDTVYNNIPSFLKKNRD